MNDDRPPLFFHQWPLPSLSTSLDNYLASSQASSMPSRTAHSVYRYSNNLDFLSVNFNIVKEFPGFICNVVYRVFINVKS